MATRRKARHLGNGSIVRYQNKKYKKVRGRWVRLGWFGWETNDVTDFLDDIIFYHIILEVLSQEYYDDQRLEAEAALAAEAEAAALAAEAEAATEALAAEAATDVEVTSTSDDILDNTGDDVEMGSTETTESPSYSHTESYSAPEPAPAPVETAYSAPEPSYTPSPSTYSDPTPSYSSCDSGGGYSGGGGGDCGGGCD